MATFLLAWNPKKWAWVDQAEAIVRINNSEPYDIYWSCGRTRRINVGDTFLLMKLGVEPKGIVGCGYIISTPYELLHWNAEKASRGDHALRCDLFFRMLSEIPLVPLELLQERFPSYKWTPQESGVSVPDEIAPDVLSLIGFDAALKRSDVDRYVEGMSKRITVTTYDRSAAARQACIAHYGYDCAVCGFSFERVYGALGRRYVEVHHLNPIANFGESALVDPISDLRPVCSNCHRMLHKQRPPLSIEELRARLSKA
jgi:5-methylcytosine-specific restriction protein A